MHSPSLLQHLCSSIFVQRLRRLCSSIAIERDRETYTERNAERDLHRDVYVTVQKERYTVRMFVVCHVSSVYDDVTLCMMM